MLTKYKNICFSKEFIRIKLFNFNKLIISINFTKKSIEEF